MSHRFIYLSITSSLRRSASAVNTRNWFCRSNPSTSKINYIHGGVPPLSRRVIGFAGATPRHLKINYIHAAAECLRSQYAKSVLQGQPLDILKSTIFTRRRSASAVNTRNRFCKCKTSTFKINYIHAAAECLCSQDAKSVLQGQPLDILKSTIFTRRRSASAVKTRNRFCRGNPSTFKINYIHAAVASLHSQYA